VLGVHQLRIVGGMSLQSSHHLRIDEHGVGHRYRFTPGQIVLHLYKLLVRDLIFVDPTFSAFLVPMGSALPTLTVVSGLVPAWRG